MPSYDYECANCGVFEVSQRISENAYTQCPKCGGSEIKRLVSAPAFHLKGSGWYKTDYGSGTNGKSSSPAAKSADTTAKSSTEKPKESCSGSCACSSGGTEAPKKAD